MRSITGLSAEEVLRSREKHGDNTLVREKTKGFFKKFIENFSDPIIRILLFALLLEVIFTFGNCNWFEVGGIVLAVLIATTVTTVSEYGSELAFEKIHRESSESTVRVMRDGRVSEIPSSELVIGDVVLLGAGEKIRADGVMLKGELRVDQSALNGEGRDVKKYAAGAQEGFSLSDPARVFSGSIITGGEGVMRVVRVGVNTYYGMVAKDVQTETRISPLKLRLSRLASQISKIGYVMAAFVALTFLFNSIVCDNGFSGHAILATLRDFKTMGGLLIHALTLMITVVVVAVPEGLPMMITVVLSANMKKMLKDNVLVKKLVGIETAGSMNILFTDKTGTLTEGVLSVDRLILEGGVVRTASALRKHKGIYDDLCLLANYNTDTVLGSGAVLGGNSTDRAIRTFFLGEYCAEAQLLEKRAFSSEKKFSSATVKRGRVTTSYYKGAPEIILDQVRYTAASDGRILHADREGLLREYRKSAERGERVLALAKTAEGVDGLVFLGFAVLKDRLRTGVRSAVSEIRGAGVQVVMVTGDGKETATAIAMECGILKTRAGGIVLSAEEMAAMSDEQLLEILPRLAVIARALPQDKMRLIRLSQALGLVTGMTGDGINDAPSLKLADVGFAMGTGADIAKDAGDVVILDNSLFAIGKTILYGRTIFKSIRKFITFQLIMNFVACGVSLIGQFIGIDNPITIIQMLWVNIIMDTLGGLAFAGEAPLDAYMKEKPKKREEPILTGGMLREIAGCGLYTLSLCIAFLKLDVFAGMFRESEGGEYFMTGFYALFIFAGIANCFIARGERLNLFANIGKNRPFLVIMALISLVQILMIYFGGSLFRTAPLLPMELLRVLLLAITVIPFGFLYRILRRIL